MEHYTEGETEAQEGLTGTCVPSSPSPPQTPSIFTFSLQERTLLSPLAPPEMGQDQCGEGVGRWLETRNRNSWRLQGQGSPETTAPGLGIHRQVGATFAASPAWDHRLGASSGPGCVGTIRPISEVNPRRPEARKTAVGCGTGFQSVCWEPKHQALRGPKGHSGALPCRWGRNPAICGAVSIHANTQEMQSCHVPHSFLKLKSVLGERNPLFFLRRRGGQR